MNHTKQSAIQSICGLFFVLTIFSIGLYFARFFSESIIRPGPHRPATISISASGLTPPEIENEPNILKCSEFNVVFGNSLPFLGIVQYFAERGPRGRLSNVYEYATGGNKFLLYYDKIKGLIIRELQEEKITSDENRLKEAVKLYAGPDGVSENPDSSLGQFYQPLRPTTDNLFSSVLTYDKKLKLFYKIDFRNRNVLKSAPLNEQIKPIQIGNDLKKGSYGLHMVYQPPQKKVKTDDPNNQSDHQYRWFEFFINLYPTYLSEYNIVLDEKGIIYLLDRDTLSIKRQAGYLPAPPVLFGSHEYPKPKDLLNFGILPIAFDKPYNTYKGMGVATLSRDGTGAAAAIFDANGILLRACSSPSYSNNAQCDVTYREHRFKNIAIVAKFIFENLHPPFLSAASYLTADSFDALDGQTAIFLMPNSYIAMMGRKTDVIPLGKIGLAILLMLPSLMLSVFLAERAGKDASKIGLTKTAQKIWIAAIFLFGIPAYISYRLTKPKITLVTCPNCGDGRRPDMEICHKCNSKWIIPELQAPAWRVTN